MTSAHALQNILFFASGERIRLCFDAVVGRSSSLKGGQPRTLMRIVGESDRHCAGMSGSVRGHINRWPESRTDT
jgi:hypothetical protein